MVSSSMICPGNFAAEGGSSWISAPDGCARRKSVAGAEDACWASSHGCKHRHRPGAGLLPTLQVAR